MFTVLWFLKDLIFTFHEHMCDVLFSAGLQHHTVCYLSFVHFPFIALQQKIFNYWYIENMKMICHMIYIKRWIRIKVWVRFRLLLLLNLIQIVVIMDTVGMWLHWRRVLTLTRRWRGSSSYSSSCPWFSSWIWWTSPPGKYLNLSPWSISLTSYIGLHYSINECVKEILCHLCSHLSYWWLICRVMGK